MAKRKIPDVLIAGEQDLLLNQFLPPSEGEEIEDEEGFRPPGRPISALSRLRDLCLVRLMLNSGLRCSEVLKLRRRDIELATGRVWVRNGKGGKDRVLWLGEADVGLLTGYLEAQGNLSLGAPDSPIFLNLKGEPLQGRYVRKMVAEAAREAGVQKQVHPHTLRHTFATDLLRATKNLRLVQKALGHARVETTTIYTHIVDEELEDAMKNFRKARE